MKLLEPISVGDQQLRNRIVFGPHETNLGRGRALSDRHVAYYRRRAAGGVGLIVTEEASVHESDWPYERAPLAIDCTDGWTAVAAACAEEGAVTIAALGHAGLQGSSAYHQRELWAPSLVPDAATRELPKPMEDEDIAAVIDGFVMSAKLAVAAGLTGVEINAGQHSLIRQFLSGLTNQRNDEWSAGPRFARDVLARVRDVVGPGIIGLRLSCDELAPWAGLVPETAAAIAAELAPLVDYVAVMRGSIFSADWSRPDMHVDTGFNLGSVETVRATVPDDTPVMAQGSIVDWGQAEWAIDDGRADLVEMTRALIADPDLPTKLHADAPERIRPCLLCNQKCRVRDARNPIVSCVVNPAAGHENTEGFDIVPIGTPRPLAVVGAGPAGLELARVAAEAGHDVTIYERTGEVGGTVRTAARAAGRARLAVIIDWLEAECRRLGVIFECNYKVDAAKIAGLEAEGATVVLATGGRHGPPSYEIDDDATVLDVISALRHELPDGPAVVWDPIGGPIGIAMAETLISDRPVTLITPDPSVGTQLALTGDLNYANTRLQQAGAALVKRTVIRRVRADHVDIENRFSAEQSTIDAAVVIDAGHQLPDDRLWTETGQRLARVGDAVAPRTIHEAILEGRRLAATL